ncbi:hyaluronan synthase [Lachnospiraceae bacterium]|nr:hyaluronan synthase [Lachnospiraceae bacterium]
MKNPMITVFTTTYNRGYIIENLYKSLCNQISKDFEWVIVNDASNDNTDELIHIWIDEGKLDIHYIRNEVRGGIANAINIGIKVAKGKLFFKMDDDDELTDDAVELLVGYERTISGLSGFAGVSGLKSFKDGKAIGKEWRHKEKYIDATNFERKKYNLDHDKAEVYYVHILRKYGPFPQFEQETYAFEAILWNRIANANLKLRWFKDKICICEYLPDGETMHYFENCMKYFRAYSYLIDNYKDYRQVKFLQRFEAVSKYFAVCIVKKIKFSELRNYFNWNQWWIGIAYICGIIIYWLRLLLKPERYKKYYNI